MPDPTLSEAHAPLSDEELAYVTDAVPLLQSRGNERHSAALRHALARLRLLDDTAREREVMARVAANRGKHPEGV